MVQSNPTSVTTYPSSTYYPAYSYQGHDYFGPNHNSFTLAYYSSAGFAYTYQNPWDQYNNFLYITIINQNTNNVVYSDYMQWPYSDNTGLVESVFSISFTLPNPTEIVWDTSTNSWISGTLPMSTNTPYKIVLTVIDQWWNLNSFTIYPYYYTQNPSVSQSSIVNGGGLSPNIGNWYNSNSAVGQITVSLPTNSPGIGSVSYTVGGSSSGTTVNNPSNLVYQTQAMSNWYSSSTSNTNIVWTIVDNVGNSVSYTQNFGLDLNSPAINIALTNSSLVNGYYNSTSLYSTITTIDSGGSHLNSISYEVLQGTTVISNNVQWTTVTPSSSDSYTISTLTINKYTNATFGSFSIAVLAQDNAGNSISSTSTFNLDSVIPNGTYSTSYSSWQSNNQLSYQVSIPCPFSGISSFSITDNGEKLSTAYNSTPYLTSYPSYSCHTSILAFSIDSLYQGNNTIVVTAISGAGFTSTSITTLTQVDIVLPRFGTFSFFNSSEVNNRYNSKNIQASINVSDIPSGIKEVDFSIVDINGNVIRNWTTINGLNNIFTITTLNIPSGKYFINIRALNNANTWAYLSTNCNSGFCNTDVPNYLQIDYTKITYNNSLTSTLNLGQSLLLQWSSEHVSNFTQESVEYSINGISWSYVDVSNVYNNTWQSYIPYSISWQNGTIISYKITLTDIHGDTFIHQGSILYLDKTGPSLTLYNFVNGNTLYITGNITSYVLVKSVLLVFETSSSNFTWSTIEVPFNVNQSFNGSFVYTMNIGTNSSIRFYLIATDSLGVSHLYYQGNDIPGASSQQYTIAQTNSFVENFSTNNSANNSSSQSNRSGESIDLSIIAAGILGLLLILSIGMLRRRKSLRPKG